MSIPVKQGVQLVFNKCAGLQFFCSKCFSVVGNKYLECKVCSKQFINRDRYLQHKQSAHRCGTEQLTVRQQFNLLKGLMHPGKPSISLCFPQIPYCNYLYSSFLPTARAGRKRFYTCLSMCVCVCLCVSVSR